jgi:DNA ligase D-like protein (predicted 3'-phosphoesterase)
MPDQGRDLAKYQSMRDFQKTPEPAGTLRRLSANPTFVVQHHMARAEHYDFRLEVDGVLKSWAVPRGLSYDPKDKRLAVMTEDHPLEYAAFEGIIPKGEYGGGTVMVWDTGLYWNRSANKHGRPLSMRQAIEEGHLKIWLQGNKLSGGWALSRMKEENGKEQWIVLKHADETAGTVSPEDRSVLTGRTMDQIREAADAVWSGRGRVG